MVTLPPPFTALKHSGYFWNTEDKKLYSLKVTGELRPLKCRFKWNVRTQHSDPMIKGYTLSVRGRPIFIAEDELMKLNIENSEIKCWRSLGD